MLQSHSAPPAFPSIPSFSAMTSFDETGCCCGTQCSCPGCTVHRGAEHAAKDVRDCTAGECGTCVDHASGDALPAHVLAYSQGGYASAGSSSGQPSGRKEGTSFIDAFFATAAALPAPPCSMMTIKAKG